MVSGQWCGIAQVVWVEAKTGRRYGCSLVVLSEAVSEFRAEEF